MAITTTGNSRIGGAAVHITLNPKATFLRTNTDPAALNAVAISLSTLGIAAGDIVSIEKTGDYDPDGANPGTDTSSGMRGVFSSSSTLLASTNQTRVPGALYTDFASSYGTRDFVSQPTGSGGLPTDIPHDFEIYGMTLVQVPVTASALFLSPDDSFFGDNTDPNGNWGVNIFRPMSVGIDTTGTLTITGGSEVTDGLIIGSKTTGNGTVTVTSNAVFNIGGANSPDGSGKIDGGVLVGYSGTGTLIINGGADVNVNQGSSPQDPSIGGFVGLGIYAGASGTITVTGAGSSLNLNGEDNFILVGGSGTGTLNIQNNAAVNALGIGVGARASGNLSITGGADLNLTRNAAANETYSPSFQMARYVGSTAIGLISGAGSSVNLTQVGANAQGWYGPEMVVGKQGDATLTVENNAQVNVSGDDAFLGVSTAWDNDGVSPTSLLSQSDLIIQSGADVTVNHGATTNSWNVSAGNNQFGNGKITVTGAGSTLVSQGSQNEIAIGGRGNGALDVLSGGSVSAQRLTFGSNDTGIGTGVISGLNSTLTLVGAAVFADDSNANLTVGNQGTGALTVQNNATVNLSGDRSQIHIGDGYNAPGAGVMNIESGAVVTVNQGTNSQWGTTVFVGQGPTATGTLNITGNGSKLVSIGNKNFITVGNEGAGTLNVTAGADIEGKGLEFGVFESSNGTGTIDGVGSSVTLAGPAVYDASNREAQLTVGINGNGTLTVRNSATVSLTGDRAKINIGTNWDNVAAPGEGILNIQSGAVVTVNHGIASANYATVSLGDNALAKGTLNISGAGSQLQSIGNHNEIVVGERGTGIVNINNAGVASAQRMFVGMNDTGVGTVSVDGLNSALNLSGPTVYDATTQNPGLWVSNRGDGTMTVSNSAQVNVTGARAHLFVGDGYAAVAAGKTGVLNILTGADVTVTNTDTIEQRGTIDIGTQTFGDGTITVNGIGSTLVAAGASPFINIGNQGRGIVNVQAGGVVKSLGMGVGDQTGSNGRLNIDGAGSKVVLSNDTHTGAFWGDKYGGFLAIGQNNGAYGRADITNGGILEIRNTLATQKAPGLQLGDQQGSVGILNLSGATSAINISLTGATSAGNYGPFLGIGRKGDGTMTVSNGAQVNMSGESLFMQVSRGNDDGEPGAPARATLSELFVQSGADVNLTAANGSYYGAGFVLGNRTNGNGRVTVDGNGSSMNLLGNNTGNTAVSTAFVTVGNDGQGEMLIQNGGDLLIDGGDDKRPVFTIGKNQTGIGTTTVSGIGSTISLATTNAGSDGGGLLAVGRFGGSNGTMNILNGAVVVNDLNSTNSATVVGQGDTATGTLVVDGNGNATTLLDAGALLVVGAGWDGTSSALTSVNFANGGVGSAAVRNAATVRADMTAVGTDGVITGNGTFDGSVTVDAGGTISPGNSPGRLTVTGSLNAINAKLAMEVNGLAVATQYDQLKVNGAVTLGTVALNLTTAAAFNFAAGNSLVLIDGGTTLAANLANITVNLTGEPATLAYALADAGNDLVFEALNSGTGAAVMKMGPASLVGATASLDISTGLGSGTGGRFDSVRFVGATGLQGTLGADTLSLLGATGGKLEGLAGIDRLNGTNAVDTLDGGTEADIMTGGDGSDVYIVDNVNDNVIEAAGAAAGALDYINASVSFTNKANVERLFLTGTDAINGTGLTTQADYIVGNSAVNTLTGLGGNDYLDGKAGADIMVGGLNSDTYVVDDASDVVTELAGASAGTMDIINASISFTIAANVERLNLTGTADLSATGRDGQADLLVGNSGANILSGLGGNDNLQGAGGADSMIGGDGNDLYYIENTGDTVTEGNGALSGIDAIYSTVSVTNFANVERIYLQGSAAINATGLDGQNDQITGNSGGNTLSGGSGNDILDGGLGNDIMIGGDGNDSYYVDAAGDVVTEAAGAAAGTNDAVNSAISFTNVANIERITLTGLGNTSATGFGSQNEIFFGNNGNNTIDGGDGADLISGGFGLDTLTGGLGSDTFRFDKNLNALTNKDTITDYNVAADTIQLDNAIFTQLFATLGNPLSTGVLNTSLFGFAATADADDRIIYNATTGELAYDINGNVAGGATVFAQLSAGLALTNLDFVVI